MYLAEEITQPCNAWIGFAIPAPEDVERFGRQIEWNLVDAKIELWRKRLGHPFRHDSEKIAIRHGKRQGIKIRQDQHDPAFLADSSQLLIEQAVGLPGQSLPRVGLRKKLVQSQAVRRSRMGMGRNAHHILDRYGSKRDVLRDIDCHPDNEIDAATI